MWQWSLATNSSSAVKQTKSTFSREELGGGGVGRDCGTGRGDNLQVAGGGGGGRMN